MIAQILLDRKISFNTNFHPGTLTYGVPESLKAEIRIGDFVEVPLRKQQVRGVVIGLNKSRHDAEKGETKEISTIITPQILLPWQLKLLNFLSSFPEGKAYRFIKKFIPDYIFDGKLASMIEERILPSNTKSAINLFISSRESQKWDLLRKKIQKIIDKNLQVLILTPEIEPAPLWIAELEKIAPTTTFTGKKTPKQHALLWQKIARNEIKIVVGSKLGPFAPLRSLGLIIVTNEHGRAYEEETQPKIHIRDITKKIHEFSECEIIFESPCPSLTTFEQSKKNHWNTFETKRRIATEIIDLRDEIKRRNHSPLSERLQEKLTEIVKKNSSAILFLNRRGTGGAMLCRDCGHIERCETCTVPYATHKGEKGNLMLICHRCKKTKSSPAVCPNCHSTRIKILGTGTEKVEQELKRLFPQITVIRIDKDVIKNSKELERVSQTFREKKPNQAGVLLTTSMLHRDLMIESPLIAALLPDITLSYPSIESSEVTLQQLCELKTILTKDGEFLIQTYIPDHEVFSTFISGEKQKFYENEGKSRRIFDKNLKNMIQ
jgi:primosomal protein N' (replication factor Y)